MKTKTDLYTKVILTVIAVFLGILVFQNATLTTTAYASTPPVNITPPPQQPKVLDVNIVQVNGNKISSYNHYGYGSEVIRVKVCE